MTRIIFPCPKGSAIFRNSNCILTKSHWRGSHWLTTTARLAWQEVTEDSIIRLGKDHVIYSGYYTFELTKDGVTKAAKAK